MENQEEVSDDHPAEVVVVHSILLIDATNAATEAITPETVESKEGVGVVLVHVAAAVHEAIEPVHVLLVLILAADPVPDPDDHTAVAHVTLIPSHRNDQCDDQIATVVVRHRNVLIAVQRAVLHPVQETVGIEISKDCLFKFVNRSSFNNGM